MMKPYRPGPRDWSIIRKVGSGSRVLSDMGHFLQNSSRLIVCATTEAGRALDLRGRRAKFSQHAVAQSLRIALTGLRNIYDLVGEHFIGKVAALRESKRYPRHLVCEADDPDRLWVKIVAIEVGADRHVHLPAYRRECYRLSVTDAWADAAVDDGVPYSYFALPSVG
jgi:hypothetical protein